MRAITMVAMIVSAIGLSGCVTSRLHLSDDYGRAIRQDTVAQVGDPDAKYVGIPDAASDGRRSFSAVDRYAKGEVKAPPSTKTSTVSVGGGGGQSR